MPTLRSIHDKYGKKGFEIVSIHTANGSDKMKEFVTKNNLAWPQLIDIKEKSESHWHVKYHPSYFLLDRTGSVVYASIAKQSLESAIRQMLEK